LPLSKFTFYEFFAGGGMARAGLGKGWQCVFANDFDHKKAVTYRANWGDNELVVSDVRQLSLNEIPGRPDMIWGSFPCQDLSLAGGGAGLRGDRSGTFWPFWQQVQKLIDEGRSPSVVVLENVLGTLTSHGGKDFSAICEALRASGYRFGAVVIDAALFVPHSRPRLFVVALRNDIPLAFATFAQTSLPVWHNKALVAAYDKLDDNLKGSWVWWRMSAPMARATVFADLIEESPASVRWHSHEETNAILSMMSAGNLAKVQKAACSGRRMVGAIYKRTRFDEKGVKVQRAEVRFDDMAGCLRTPAGGSSRQLIMLVSGSSIRSRLISSRETARLMGLPDSYVLPENYNEAYHLTGDGVAVPVVRHLAEHLIEPLVASSLATIRKVA
jgi:DNA (cytosine-5)-methyltransferase 1